MVTRYNNTTVIIYPSSTSNNDNNNDYNDNTYDYNDNTYGYNDDNNDFPFHSIPVAIPPRWWRWRWAHRFIGQFISPSGCLYRNDR